MPWARDPEMSFLLTADETRAAVMAAGFEEASFADRTATVVQGAHFWARNGWTCCHRAPRPRHRPDLRPGI